MLRTVSHSIFWLLGLSVLVLPSSFTFAQTPEKPTATPSNQKKQQETSSKSVAVTKTEDFQAKLLKANRVIFLGDSNTNHGEYINQIELTLRSNFINIPEMINLGLSSETCCGLSEPIHPFPRPNVQERLARALEKTKPDFVFACYGMNDGIYHPFAKDRFDVFKTGVNKIVTACQVAQIPLVLLTPPPFDPLPMSKSGKLAGLDAKEFSWKTIYKNYDSEVIKKYSDWMLSLDNANCLVIDTHTPINAFLSEKRKTDPDFAFSMDGVHFDHCGHEVFAGVVLRGMGFNFQLAEGPELMKLIRKRRSISHAAWLSEVGHLRPGVKPGLPMPEAKKKLNAIFAEMGK